MKTFGLGRLTADPELIKVKAGDKEVDLVKFCLAINEFRGRGEDRVKDSHFFDCEAWDSGAKLIAERCRKGHRLLVEGKLREQKWEDKETGQKRRKVIIRVEKFQFIESGDKEPENSDEESF